MADRSEDVIPVEVEAQRENPTKSTVTVRDFELVVDEPDELGGTDEGPNPLEYQLAAQAGCLNVTASQVAKQMDVAIENLDIAIEGEFDLEAFQHGEPDDRTGIRNIAVTLSVEADADEDALREWGERVEQRCPVSDTIRRETEIDLSVESG